jgi:hypothetical protein
MRDQPYTRAFSHKTHLLFFFCKNIANTSFSFVKLNNVTIKFVNNTTVLRALFLNAANAMKFCRHRSILRYKYT